MSSTKKQYHALITDTSRRKERNGRLLARLDNIEKKAAFLQAKTDRIKSLKSIYKNQVSKPAPSPRQVSVHPQATGRVITERVPVNFSSYQQDYTYNPLQYSNYRYERIYNEPNPIYTLKPITLDDAIEEISRRFVLVPKKTEDPNYPLPDERIPSEYSRRNEPSSRQYNPYENFPPDKRLYEKDKRIPRQESDRFKLPKYYDDDESIKSHKNNGIKATKVEGHSSNDTDGSEKNSRGSEPICNERYLKDKDDSTEKDAKEKVPQPDKINSDSLNTSKGISDDIEKDDTENKESNSDLITPVKKVVKEPPQSMNIKEIKTVTEVKESKSEINDNEDVRDEKVLDEDLQTVSQSSTLDQQLIENEPNALYVSNENIHQAAEVDQNVNYEIEEQTASNEIDESQVYDDTQQNYQEGYDTTQQGEYAQEYTQEQTEVDPTQQVSSENYNPEQYSGYEGQQGEYDPNQAEYSNEQYAESAQEHYDPNQQGYDQYQTQSDQNADNTVQDQQQEYDPNQQYYYGENAGAENPDQQQYAYDPNYVDPAAENQGQVDGQQYAETEHYVEGENTGAVEGEPNTTDQYYAENNYQQEYPQETEQNYAAEPGQTYEGTEGTEYSQDATGEQYAEYPNAETSEDTNLGQTYDGTEQVEYNQNQETYEQQETSQYYDETITGDPQPHEEQTPAAQPLKILESDTDVSNREEPSKLESDFDFSAAQ